MYDKTTTIKKKKKENIKKKKKSWEPALVWPVAQVSWDCLWFFQSDKDSASEMGLPGR